MIIAKFCRKVNERDENTYVFCQKSSFPFFALKGIYMLSCCEPMDVHGNTLVKHMHALILSKKFKQIIYFEIEGIYITGRII